MKTTSTFHINSLRTAFDSYNFFYLRKVIQSLQEENLSLQENNQALEARLERHALKGDYDPRCTKVVHLQENPFQKEVDLNLNKMDQLVDENMKLKEVEELIN